MNRDKRPTPDALRHLSGPRLRRLPDAAPHTARYDLRNKGNLSSSQAERPLRSSHAGTDPRSRSEP